MKRRTTDNIAFWAIVAIFGLVIGTVVWVHISALIACGWDSLWLGDRLVWAYWFGHCK